MPVGVMPISRAIRETQGWCPAYLSPAVLIRSCVLILFMASLNLEAMLPGGTPWTNSFHPWAL